MKPSPTRVAHRYLTLRTASRWHPYSEYVVTGDDEPDDEDETVVIDTAPS